jgi:hypothetical protein
MHIRGHASLFSLGKGFLKAGKWNYFPTSIFPKGKKSLLFGGQKRARAKRK